jgi:WD40 repeat protein
MSLSIGPKGQWIAATRVDDLLRLYSLSGEHSLVELRLRSPNTKTVAFAPSGPRFAALGADGQVTVWRVQGTTSTPLLSVAAAPARSKAGQSESLARRVSWIAWQGAQRLIAATVAGNVLVLNLAEADWRMRAEEIALWVD